MKVVFPNLVQRVLPSCSSVWFTLFFFAFPPELGCKRLGTNNRKQPLVIRRASITSRPSVHPFYGLHRLVRHTFGFLFCRRLWALTKRWDDIVVADTVAIMESNMVADMEVDIVATVNKEVHHHKFALADYTAMSFIFVNIFMINIRNTNQWVGRSTKFAHITKEVSGIGIGIGIGVQYYLENIEILNIEMRWKWRWVIIILNIILMLEWKVEEEGVASVGLYEDCGAETHTCAICSTSTCTTAILVLFTVLHSYCAIYCTSTCTHLYLYHNIHVPFTVPHICLYF